MTTPRPSTIAHLDALVAAGANGWLVITSTPDRRRWPSKAFRPDQIDKAAAYARQRDLEGHDVYVRTNLTARPPEPGKRGEVRDTGTAVAFVADLDIAGPSHNQGTGKFPLPPDLPTALSIVEALPEPTLHIATGGGVHLWWLFEDPTCDHPVELLEEWADRIVAAGARRGWHVDRPDAARVLRVAGTTRRKTVRATGEQLVNHVELVSAAGWPEGLLHRRPWAPTLGYYRHQELLDALPPPPPPAPPPPPRRPRRDGEVGPADAVSRLAWSDILGPAGWEYVGPGRVNGTEVELWRWPGSATGEHSIKCFPDGPAVVWSDTCGLPAGRGQKLNKWRVFCHLHGGGDETSTGREIRRRAREVARG